MLEADQAKLAQTYLGTSALVDRDTKLNRVEVQISKGEQGPQAASLTSLPPTAVIVTDVEPRGAATVLYGGLPITGFTIYYGSNTSNRGVATAGHCSNTQSYLGHTLTYQNDEIHSGNYDAQSHKLSGATYTNQVDDGEEPPRRMTSRSYWVNQNVGDFVCKYGKVTGFGCGYIVSNHDPGCVGGAATYYLKVDSDPNGTGYDLAQGGDSGGPWFYSNTAYGITSCQQGYDAIYESTGFVEVALGAHILITSP